MRRLPVAMLALSTAVAMTSMTGAAQARDDHHRDRDGYRHSDNYKHRHHHHRRDRRGPNIYLGLGDGYYDNGVSIGIGDRRHRRDRYYD